MSNRAERRGQKKGAPQNIGSGASIPQQFRNAVIQSKRKEKKGRSR